MNFFGRLGRMWRAFLNLFMGKLENHNPQLLLNQAVDDLQTQLNSCRTEVAQAIAQEKKLGKQLQECSDNEKKWGDRAIQAVQQENDVLAGKALERKKQFSEQVDALRPSHEAQLRSTQSLKEKLKKFEEMIDQKKRDKTVLIARVEAAEAQNQIAKAQTSFSGDGAFAAFEQMEGRVDQLEAEAEGLNDVAELSGDTLEDEFKQLGASSVSDELAALKAAHVAGELPGSTERTESTVKVVSEKTN